MQKSAVEGIVKLTLGEPDFPTPEHVKAAGIQSIENDETIIPRAKRLPGLRAAASRIIWQQSIKPPVIRETQILITAGGYWRYLFEFNGYVEQRRYREYPNSDFFLYTSQRVIKRSKTNIYRHFGGWVHS